eukprot:6014108-Pyramimonas_sp.AAC.1
MYLPRARRVVCESPHAARLGSLRDARGCSLEITPVRVASRWLRGARGRLRGASEADDSPSGECLAVLEGHAGSVLALCIAGGHDRYIYVTPRSRCRFARVC